jgi:hypothetical protein
MWQELMHILKPCHEMGAGIDVDCWDIAACEETCKEDFQMMVA